MGLIEGTADYLFLWHGGAAALEAKTPSGRQTDRQTAYQEWCERERVPYFVFRSAAEALDILRQLGI